MSPVTIDEVHAEVAPEPDRGGASADEERSGASSAEVERRVRAVLARERRRARRLSDR